MTTADSVPTSAEQRAEKIRAIVCEILEIEPGDMTSASLFLEDHDADSLRAIEILAALERNFSITIDQADLSRMVNLAGVCEVVTGALERA